MERFANALKLVNIFLKNVSFYLLLPKKVKGKRNF